MSTLSNAAELSLYKRLGGYDVIAAVIADMFGLMRADPRFSRFNQGRSIDSKMRAQQLTVEQMCALSGGPCVYLGRDMKTSHAGLGITEQEWDATMEFTRAALKRNNIPEREQQEFLDIFERYHGDIVESPNAK
jgi:hemoglobin